MRSQQLTYFYSSFKSRCRYIRVSSRNYGGDYNTKSIVYEFVAFSSRQSYFSAGYDTNRIEYDFAVSQMLVTFIFCKRRDGFERSGGLSSALKHQVGIAANLNNVLFLRGRRK